MKHEQRRGKDTPYRSYAILGVLARDSVVLGANMLGLSTGITIVLTGIIIWGAGHKRSLTKIPREGFWEEFSHICMLFSTRDTPLLIPRIYVNTMANAYHPSLSCIYMPDCIHSYAL